MLIVVAFVLSVGGASADDGASRAESGAPAVAIAAASAGAAYVMWRARPREHVFRTGPRPEPSGWARQATQAFCSRLRPPPGHAPPGFSWPSVVPEIVGDPADLDPRLTFKAEFGPERQVPTYVHGVFCSSDPQATYSKCAESYLAGMWRVAQRIRPAPLLHEFADFLNKTFRNVWRHYRPYSSRTWLARYCGRKFNRIATWALQEQFTANGVAPEDKASGYWDCTAMLKNENRSWFSPEGEWKQGRPRIIQFTNPSINARHGPIFKGLARSAAIEFGPDCWMFYAAGRDPAMLSANLQYFAGRDSVRASGDDVVFTFAVCGGDDPYVFTGDLQTLDATIRKALAELMDRHTQALTGLLDWLLDDLDMIRTGESSTSGGSKEKVKFCVNWGMQSGRQDTTFSNTHLVLKVAAWALESTSHILDPDERWTAICAFFSGLGLVMIGDKVRMSRCVFLQMRATPCAPYEYTIGGETITMQWRFAPRFERLAVRSGSSCNVLPVHAVGYLTGQAMGLGPFVRHVPLLVDLMSVYSRADVLFGGIRQREVPPDRAYRLHIAKPREYADPDWERSYAWMSEVHGVSVADLEALRDEIRAIDRLPYDLCAGPNARTVNAIIWGRGR